MIEIGLHINQVQILVKNMTIAPIMTSLFYNKNYDVECLTDQ